MSNLSEAKKLKENEPLFINKPLRTLLKEIKPQIRMASAQTNRPDGMHSYIIFRFVPANEYYKSKSGSDFTRITVFIKEKFQWDQARSSLNRSYDWSKKDDTIYGDLTVVDLWVSGTK